jgi:DNA-binding ferritin-like protein
MTKIVLNTKVFEGLKKRGIIKEQSEISNKFESLISKLLHSRTQTHIFHLQSDNFSQHKALDEYYDDIVDLIDDLVESYQGEFGIIKNYQNYDLEVYKNNDQVVKFLTGLSEDVNDLRETLGDSFLVGKLDEVVELINSTLYKLKNLK